ncbi:MAG TPA: hypothetical protein VKP67_29535 [Xanthobacteraceae bacterium]|nr:hypothetical protein [Xanthobacteraceae bacterium]
MRKMLPFGIATILTAVAITAWATAMTRSQKYPETAGIDILTLMTASTKLQVQQYDAF